MRPVRIKSSTLVQTISWVRETFGPGVAAEILEPLPTIIRQQVDLPRLDAWVPFEIFDQVLHAVVERCYGGDVTRIAESGRYSAIREFPRRFLSLSLPGGASLADQLSTFTPLWRILVDRGHIKVEQHAEQIELHVCEMPVVTEVYGYRLAGWLEGYFECLTGESWKVTLHACDPQAQSNLIFHITPAPSAPASMR